MESNEKIEIVCTPHERTWKLKNDFVPKTADEFKEVVDFAPTDILKDMGFRKWDTMNNIIRENQDKPKSNLISIPAINMDGSDAPDFVTDIGIGDAPTKELEVDEDIWLIPGEWYNSIPDGTLLTGLWGETTSFKKGKSDDDIRFGCLAYGIRRPIK